MRKRTNKKGFTLVELLVVIAILAVLATVSVVGYLGFTKKAKISNDISLTTQMNTILQAEEAGGETFDTPHDAVEALQNGGLDISKLTPTTNNYSYVYDLKQNRMFLLDETKTKVAPSNQEMTKDSNGNVIYNQLYAFVGKCSEMSSWSGYSFYLKDNFSFDSGNIDVTTASAKSVLGQFDTLHVMDGGDSASNGSSNNEVKVKTGLDAGTNKNINVTFNGKVDSDVVIRTVGDQSQVSIKTQVGSAANASVSVYGFAKEVKVESNSTVNVAGSCKDLNVTSGTVKVEETAMITTATVSSGSKIESKGYVGEKKGDGTFDGKEGGNYEISTLAQLEAFRDTVNAGNTFEDFNAESKSVVLTSDITLKNGWTPIGEGFREYASGGVKDNSATYFKGTFNGNNHTISNLNNIGYTPTNNRLGAGNDDDTKSYCYGLFSLIDSAKIENLKLSNVNIDGSRHTGANMDSVAALVGFCSGNSKISNITVSGTIKAKDAVAGIVGRWYNLTEDNEISSCVNKASVYSDVKGAGIVGYFKKATTGKKLTIKECENSGTIYATVYADQLATGACNSNTKVISNNALMENSLSKANGSVTSDYSKPEIYGLEKDKDN